MDTDNVNQPRKCSLNLARFAFQPRKGPHAHGSVPIIPQALHSLDELPKSRKRLSDGPASPRKKNARKIDPVENVRLPDFLQEGLDILIVGFNPGFNSASHGHHYAGPGNHFWKCLHLSGLVPEPLTYSDDTRILDFKIGLTNIVSRPSTTSSDLTKAELKNGATELRRKILQYRPKIVAFNGLGIYEVFAGCKDFPLGKQKEGLPGTSSVLYVMPSSSPRGSKWPRLEDKLMFYQGLAHLRDFLTGRVGQLETDRIVFSK